jgi:hypothetical protein
MPVQPQAGRVYLHPGSERRSFVVRAVEPPKGFVIIAHTAVRHRDVVRRNIPVLRRIENLAQDG